MYYPQPSPPHFFSPPTIPPPYPLPTLSSNLPHSQPFTPSSHTLQNPPPHKQNLHDTKTRTTRYKFSIYTIHFFSTPPPSPPSPHPIPPTSLPNRHTPPPPISSILTPHHPSPLPFLPTYSCQSCNKHPNHEKSPLRIALISHILYTFAL